jgi:hypothetical protein
MWNSLSHTSATPPWHQDLEFAAHRARRKPSWSDCCLPLTRGLVIYSAALARSGLQVRDAAWGRTGTRICRSRDDSSGCYGSPHARQSSLGFPMRSLCPEGR